MSICGKMIKRGVMAEPRPCVQVHNHKGRCGSPDLTGMVFGNLIALKQGEPKLNRKGSRMWVVKNVAEGQERNVPSSSLVSGYVQGKRSNLYVRNGVKSPEYATVHGHWYSIFKSNRKEAHVYKGMPFHDEWNPYKGGAFWQGAKWIVENLGEKPGIGWSMDTIKHDLGFVPGNLRWANRSTQRQNQQHRTLGQFTDEDFLIEAKKRGFFLVKVA